MRMRPFIDRASLVDGLGGLIVTSDVIRKGDSFTNVLHLRVSKVKDLPLKMVIYTK